MKVRLRAGILGVANLLYCVLEEKVNIMTLQSMRVVNSLKYDLFLRVVRDEAVPGRV